MAELRFLVEFTASIAVVAVPVAILIRRVSGQDGIDFGDLVRPAPGPLLRPAPAEEDPPPRWRPECIRPWSVDDRTGIGCRPVDPGSERGRFIGRGEPI